MWETEYDIYGKLRNTKGDKFFIKHRQLGQYEDEELDGLYLNRFRFYDSNTGLYISQDPIGLEGNNPNFYAYVWDSNSWIDPYGLECKAPNGYKTGDVDSHRNLSPGTNRAIGHTNTRTDDFVQSHHPIQDVWAKKRIGGYNRNNAPATLLKSSSGNSHANISAAQRIRRAAEGGWDKTLKQEFNISYREMLDVGVSPKQAQKALKDAYKYFDNLRGQNANNPFFDL